MRRVLIALAMVTGGVCAGEVGVRLDEKLHRRVEWTGAGGRTIVAFEEAAQDGVRVSGVECAAFRALPGRKSEKRVVDAEFGPGVEVTAAGLCDAGGVRIEREVRMLLPERFPNVVLLRSAYVNRGEERVRVERVDSARMVLDRSLAEPKEAPYEFASFQGGAYQWGREYAAIRLKPGFTQTNFQGALDVKGPEGVGGGMPFVDVWSPVMGVAVAHVEKRPEWVSLPVVVREDGRVSVGVTESPEAKFRQKEWLAPGERYETVTTALIFHRLDFHDALRTYGQLLRARGVAIPETSPKRAYEAYWKSWGWERDFTREQFLAKLPELESFGIKMANLDDGWQNNVGDWEPDPRKFPKGDADMKSLVREVHARGFRIGYWWYPFGVHPQSKAGTTRKDLLVQAEDGSYPLDPNELYQLCPAHEASLERVRELVVRMVKDWDGDGVYTDFMGLSAVPPCFNAAHKHESPLDSFRAMPRMYETIARTLKELKAEPYNEVCICSLPHSPYYMPYYDVANASDPRSSWHVRSRIKVEKAIRGGTFAVGDCYQVPSHEWAGSSVQEDFESAIGTGGQLTTFYMELDGRQRGLWKRWFREYAELGLSSGEYVNLYDLAFDKPEGHVVKKGGELFYGFYAEAWPRTAAIALRGLEKGKTYEVFDYANGRDLGRVSGDRPEVKAGFKGSLLVRVREAK